MKHLPLTKMLAGAVIALTIAGQPALAADRHAGKDKDKKEALYPNATRAEPKLDLTSDKDQKAVNEALDAVNEGDKDKAPQLLQAIIDGSKSKYAQALALQGLANMKYNDGDLKGAIATMQQALDNGVLPNDTYFQLEYEQAQFYAAAEQYQQSLDTIAKWRAEGRKETADSYALEGNDDYRLGKYPEAIAAIKKAQSLTDKPDSSWNQILMASYAESGQSDQAAALAQQQLAANPNDTNALYNAVAVLTQSQKYPQAIDLLEKSRSAGAFKEEKPYITLAKLYLVSGQDSDDPKPNATKAAAVLEEGLGKGVVQGNADNYKLLGDAAYISEQPAKALDAYKKAIPLASDGEPALRAGQLLISQDKYAEAKPLIQQGISKGIEHKGRAYMLLAEADRGLKDKAGAIAAMKQAAQDPDTAAKANAWLKQTNSGK